MIKHIAIVFLFLSTVFTAAAQIPLNVQVQIAKAEDARDFDGLKPFLFSKDLKIQSRAVLAAARVGDRSSVDAMGALLENGDASIRPLAAFALGEIEAEHGAVYILRALADAKTPGDVRARAVEAAGKIAAANPKDPSARKLTKAIVDTLEAEYAKGEKQDRETVLLALTAALRARPEGGDAATAKFLTSADARIRADAANTLSRLRAKNANETLRKMVTNDPDPVARANAARALGSAEDKGAVDLLINAATTDTDLRVRVSAMRSLAALKDAKTADALLSRGEKLLDEYKKSKFRNPSEKNELIEIATGLAKIIANSDNPRAIAFLHRFGRTDRYTTTEVLTSLADISPRAVTSIERKDTACDGIGVMLGCDVYSRNYSLAIAEFAKLPPENEFHKKAVKYLEDSLVRMAVSVSPAIDDQTSTIGLLEAYGAFKEAKPEFILPYLKLKHDFVWDPFVRAMAGSVLADLPATKDTVKILQDAFELSLVRDKHENDAQLAILDALFKLDKKESAGTLLMALNAPDYLVRKKAFELLSDDQLQKDLPDITTSLESARAKHKDQVLPYSPATGTKLGQLLNTDADYRRALSRKNGIVKAIVSTEKGSFTIDLLPEDAPLTVDNFIKLARSNYFNGLEVHRVVPNFVMQDGDPRGDGNGGPGWSIRCEINMVPYERGAVGMALSGKDTGGSQWFVTHSPQPHLDGGYTVFGRVNETGMKIVDNIVRGDKIMSIKIVEGSPMQRVRRKLN